MLLKKYKQNNLVRALYSSSTVFGSLYDEKNNTLTIIFSKGGRYKFSEISNKEYNDFETSESTGEFFNQNFKKLKPYEKLEKMTDNEIVIITNQINTLKSGNDVENLKGEITKLNTTEEEKTEISDNKLLLQTAKKDLVLSAILLIHQNHLFSDIKNEAINLQEKLNEYLKLLND